MYEVYFISTDVLSCSGQGEVTGVKYDFHSPGGPKIYPLPPSSEPRRNLAAPLAVAPNRQFYGAGRGRVHRRRRPAQSPPHQQQQATDDPMSRRRRVYRDQLYSQRVGTNRLSQYREITPQVMNQDENLLSRARKWIRRELQVFAFLNPDNQETTGNTDGGDVSTVRRRANNAEFLLEYIVAILRTVDIKGSGGQAEELLQEFLGRDNARLFLHELQAWLRSPYNSLEDWDRAVQYDEQGERLPNTGSQTGENRTPVSDHPPRYGRGSLQTRGIRKPHMQQRRSGLFQQRRLQSARDRYMPD